MPEIAYEAWLFERGCELIDVIKETNPAGSVQLFVYGRGPDVERYDCASLTECRRRQAEIEQSLFGSGFQLAHPSALRIVMTTSHDGKAGGVKRSA